MFRFNDVFDLKGNNYKRQIGMLIENLDFLSIDESLAILQTVYGDCDITICNRSGKALWSTLSNEDFLDLIAAEFLRFLPTLKEIEIYNSIFLKEMYLRDDVKQTIFVPIGTNNITSYFVVIDGYTSDTWPKAREVKPLFVLLNATLSLYDSKSEQREAFYTDSTTFLPTREKFYLNFPSEFDGEYSAFVIAISNEKELLLKNGVNYLENLKKKIAESFRKERNCVFQFTSTSFVFLIKKTLYETHPIAENLMDRILEIDNSIKLRCVITPVYGDSDSYSICYLLESNLINATDNMVLVCRRTFVPGDDYFTEVVSDSVDVESTADLDEVNAASSENEQNTPVSEESYQEEAVSEDDHQEVFESSETSDSVLGSPESDGSTSVEDSSDEYSTELTDEEKAEIMNDMRSYYTFDSNEESA